ncbi:MAG: hypothetical protein KDJ45_02765 [Hyphomicrobiaceae bacterium]|nr:hypothetical protein [Hyphomicrobiaceae bacterium]MCC0009915.1 hypothetical protein [Hyphomicrobiaceae bacterium]
MMRAISKNFVVALASTIAFGGAAAAYADGLSGQKMTPRHGISFDVGSKRAVSYYLGEGGVCNLTVLMADSNNLDEVKGAATRVSMPVIPTKKARIDTAEGKTLEFKCAPSASAMSVRVLDQVAVAAPRQ